MSREIYPETAEESLISPQPRKQKFCLSIFSCFCCCCIKNQKEITRKFWAKLWSKLSNKKDFDPVYTTLFHLYSQQPAIEELKRCNISPDPKKSSREDLEFYVPQICNLLLFIYNEDVKALLMTILYMCRESFYFAHRVLWCLNSTNFRDIEATHLDPYILIQTISKVAKEHARLYIEKWQKIEEVAKEIGMSLTESGLIYADPYNIEYEEVKHALKLYSSQELNMCKSPLNVKYIPLGFFSSEINPDPFDSTMAFIDKLTSISTTIMKSSDKKSVLQKELIKVNENLPACVYIPFNNPKLRESFVLHIPISEAKVFTTKERAPYLICIEVFRPLQEFKMQRNINNSYMRRSMSSGADRGFAKSFMHNHSTSFLEKMATQTIDPRYFKGPTQSMMIPRLRPAHSLTQEYHYDTFKDSRLNSLAVVYEVDTSDSSEDIIKSFKKTADRIRQNSPYGTLNTWSLVHVIVKSGDDLRQEQLAMQLISFFLQTFKEKSLKLWLYAYDILATGQDCGILECVPDAISIDALKKATQRKTLYEYFLQTYGEENSHTFRKARKCFMRSLAGYSLLCYILQIKDRHNGNILMDKSGHIIHIDFGFMLSNAPGKGMKFEKAPFKLTDEFENLLGGRRSNFFIKFRTLCVKGFTALKDRAEQIILMVDMMRTGAGASLGCFSAGEQTTKMLRERLMPGGRQSDREYINELIDESLDNWTTRCYDKFQYCCQNILY
ncbi:hypothetical protein SteCoe_20393 [Stentor coeruleus]|uniref:1-phosphatidylinositol 4-kinase n=1 Tax=Stentor coeruleus TaxID=5963 RepID=A0A1R2BS42_9CILI|nr:hypothetical protein SteCoe_20393 [Stentor coeruleus]